MSEQIENLKRRGNLYESLLNSPIKLVRVWGYESQVADVIGSRFYTDRDRKHSEEEERVISVFKLIREEINKLGWGDNKIVAECQIGYWRVFIGYWDHTIEIGYGVIPNDYMPKYKKGVFDKPDPIKIRG